jgi:sugar phosphate isomerase/epimerase
LGAATTLAAGGRFGSSQARAAAGRWTMRLSTSSVQFSSLPVEKACERIASLGFEAIDFWPSNFDCPHLEEIDKRLGPQGLNDLLAQHHLKLYAFTVYGIGYPKYAELLGKAGGGVAVRESKYGQFKAEDVRTEIRSLIESLKPQLEMAEKYDSYIAIENHRGALLNSLDSFKAFVEWNTHPRLGIALAPAHLQADKISLPEVVGLVGKQLLFFYAWQLAEGMEQLPGIGPTDCTGWITALAKANYRWYVNPFMHGHPEPDAMAESLAKSRDYLRDCYTKSVAR